VRPLLSPAQEPPAGEKPEPARSGTVYRAMCVTCALQGLEQGASAGSASGAVGLLAAGLASVGFRGAATRLLALSPRLVAVASGARSP
jgi:hypothetical protein